MSCCGFQTHYEPQPGLMKETTAIKNQNPEGRRLETKGILNLLFLMIFLSVKLP